MMRKKCIDDKSLLCLDIGTASVKACVFQETQETLELKGFSKIPQQLGNIHSGSIINISQTIENVQQAAKKAENMARKSPHDLVIGLSGELVKGMSVTLEYMRNTPQKLVDAQELKTMIHELQWQAFELIRKKISEEMSISEIGLKLVNASILSIRLDGEIISDPRGIAGNKIEMEIFNSFAPLKHFGQIQNIAVELPYHVLKGVFLQSFALCHSLALQHALGSFLVIDIGAGTTDLGVMVDGHIIGNRSFSMAGNSLTKRISYELSTSFEEAESIKISYSTESLERKSNQVVHESLLPDIDLWLSSLEFSLKELPLKKLPNIFLLSGQSSLLSEFRETLQNHEWSIHFPVEGEIEVRYLEYRDLLSGEFDTDDSSQDFLPLIAVGNTTYDLLYHNSSVEEILNGVIAGKNL